MRHKSCAMVQRKVCGITAYLLYFLFSFECFCVCGWGGVHTRVCTHICSCECVYVCTEKKFYHSYLPYSHTSSTNFCLQAIIIIVFSFLQILTHSLHLHNNINTFKNLSPFKRPKHTTLCLALSLLSSLHVPW